MMDNRWIAVPHTIHQMDNQGKVMMEKHLLQMQQAYTKVVERVVHIFLGSEPKPEDAGRFQMVHGPDHFQAWGWQEGVIFDGQYIGDIKASWHGTIWTVQFCPKVE